MNQRILVTGAAGFIGSHVCRHLLEHGDEVTGIDNFDPFYDRAIKDEAIAELTRHDTFKFIQGDVRDSATLAEHLAGMDAVIHLAARAGVRPSIEDPEMYFSLNVAGTVSLLEACRKVKLRRIVFGSSSSVYGDSTPVPFREDAPSVDPISPYAATKRSCELQCHVYSHLYDFRIASLRFFTVYGPRQRPDLAIHRFTRMLMAGEPIPQYGDGSTERDYTWVDDIVQGVGGALAWTDKPAAAFEIFNLGESCTIRLDRLIQLIGDALDVTPVVKRLPPMPGDVQRTCADIAKSRKILSYDPQTTIEQGIPKFVRWYQESMRHKT